MIYASRHAEKSGSVSKSIANHSIPGAIASAAIPTLQKKSPKDEELQMKPARRMKSTTEEFPIQKKENPTAPAANNTGMPDNLKAGIENLSGLSMDDVKVHYNSDKPARLNALAYAQGTDIHIAPGQERHLPHEAWHVVQQKQGRVRPTLQAKGVAINDDKGMEKEADMMGKESLNNTAKNNATSRFVVSKFNDGILIETANNGSINEAIQRKEVIQRIIVIPKEDVDFGIIVDAYQMLRNGIDKRVTLLEFFQNKPQIAGEEIRLLGHGLSKPSPTLKKGAFAGKPAEDLASLLKEGGVNETNQFIHLLSCWSGTGGKESYAQDFAIALKQLHTVNANKGAGITLDNGLSYSLRDQTEQEKESYKQILQGCKNECAKAKAEEEKAKEALKESKDEDAVLKIIIDFGEKILNVAGPLFTQLYNHARKLVDMGDPKSKVYTSFRKEKDPIDS